MGEQRAGGRRGKRAESCPAFYPWTLEDEGPCAPCMGSPRLGDPGVPTAEEGAEQGQCQRAQTPREVLCGGEKLQSTKHRASGDAVHRAGASAAPGDPAASGAGAAQPQPCPLKSGLWAEPSSPPKAAGPCWAGWFPAFIQPGCVIPPDSSIQSAASARRRGRWSLPNAGAALQQASIPQPTGLLPGRARPAVVHTRTHSCTRLVHMPGARALC